MIEAIILLQIISCIIIGFTIANLIRIKKASKLLNELKIDDPCWEAKISYIKEFGYMFFPRKVRRKKEGYNNPKKDKWARRKRSK